MPNSGCASAAHTPYCTFNHIRKTTAREVARRLEGAAKSARIPAVCSRRTVPGGFGGLGVGRSVELQPLFMFMLL